MRRTFLCFPGFRKKALTLSYDDGVRQDFRLIDIMKKYGLKGTFNINSGLFSQERRDDGKGRMTKEEAIELYINSGMEVAIHGYKHLSLAELIGQRTDKHGGQCGCYRAGGDHCRNVCSRGVEHFVDKHVEVHIFHDPGYLTDKAEQSQRDPESWCRLCFHDNYIPFIHCKVFLCVVSI